MNSWNLSRQKVKVPKIPIAWEGGGKRAEDLTEEPCNPGGNEKSAIRTQANSRFR